MTPHPTHHVKTVTRGRSGPGGELRQDGMCWRPDLGCHLQNCEKHVSVVHSGAVHGACSEQPERTRQLLLQG